MPTNYNRDESERRIHLVSTSPPTRQQERRLKLGDYTADIIVSKREENCCYLVLQRVGNPEILDMQRFDTAEEAEAAAHDALTRWNGEDLLHQIAS